MRKAVKLIKRTDGFVLLPEEEFTFKSKICTLIDQTNGWWIHMKNIAGGADGIGAEVIVRDFTAEDYDMIEKETGGICYIEVNYRNEMVCPMNGRGNMKIVLFTTKLEENGNGLPTL